MVCKIQSINLQWNDIQYDILYHDHVWLVGRTKNEIKSILHPHFYHELMFSVILKLFYNLYFVSNYNFFVNEIHD